MIEIQKITNNTPSPICLSSEPISGLVNPNHKPSGIGSSNSGSGNNGDPTTTSSSNSSNSSSEEEIIDCKSKVSIKDIKPGQKFFGSFNTNVKDPETGKSVKKQKMGTFKMKENKPGSVMVEDENGKEFKTSRKSIQLRSMTEEAAALEQQKKQEEEDRKKEEEEKKKIEEYLKQAKEIEAKQFDFTELEPEDKLLKTVEAGITNIWMVGPAGCGKSTMARNLSKLLDRPYLCISCGIGTSATEFVGYKYPTREATKFSEYYGKPSIILIDEFTALDPAVAQVCNAALANGEIETTTGLIHRHPDCVIIATSNTFGNGADRQYVANNQLDASTIDRFIGGIIEVDYSEVFESQYDLEVVDYVKKLRVIIKDNEMRRIASTRMIQAGHGLKNNYFKDWKQRLIVNWTDTEKHIVEKEITPLCVGPSLTKINLVKPNIEPEVSKINVIDINTIKAKAMRNSLYRSAA